MQKESIEAVETRIDIKGGVQNHFLSPWGQNNEDQSKQGTERESLETSARNVQMGFILKSQG